MWRNLCLNSMLFNHPPVLDGYGSLEKKRNFYIIMDLVLYVYHRKTFWVWFCDQDTEAFQTPTRCEQKMDPHDKFTPFLTAFASSFWNFDRASQKWVVLCQVGVQSDWPNAVKMGKNGIQRVNLWTRGGPIFCLNPAVFTKSNFSEEKPVTTENISTTKETPNVKKILFYTPYFSMNNWGFGFGQKPFERCPVSNCLTTNDRSYLNSISGFLSSWTFTTVYNA